jgi:hypothetical protein
VPDLLVRNEEALTAAAGAVDHADVVVVFVGDFQARIGERLLGRGNREVDGRVGPAGVLEVHELARVEVLDLSRGLVLVRGGVETSDLADAAAAFDETLPRCVLAVADRAYDPQPGDGDSPRVIGFAHWVFVLLEWLAPERVRQWV